MTNRGIVCPVCEWSKQAEREINSASTKPVALLVVEDDAVDMAAVERVLEQSSLSVSKIWSATTLAEALAVLKQEVPDIILLDLGLPDSSGLESVSRLQNHAHDTPIIILSGLDDQETAITAVQKGVQDYLTKRCINVCSLSRAIRYAIEREEHERQLRVMEKRYRTIFENSAVAIMMFDDHDQLISWNRVTEDLLGMDYSDLYHKRAETVYLELKWRNVEFEEGVEGDMRCHMETKMAKKGGEVIDVDVSRTVLTELRNGVEGTVYVVQDITNRKRAEMKLKEAMEETKRVNEELIEATARANDLAAQAEIASAAKSQFLANLTHDIRTPMNAIIGFSDILAEVPLESTYREYVEIIRDSGRHLICLLNDILDLSKIEAGRLQIDAVDCELPSLLETVASMMGVLARQKGLEFSVVPASGLPEVIHTDPMRLRQCLTNLVGNAIKFTEAGHVCVRVTQDDQSANRHLRFDVEDSGPGIPKDKQEFIFEPFTQLGVDAARRYEGTGLGLTITRSLAEMLGGSLLLESQQDQGSVFSLRVPVRLGGGRGTAGAAQTLGQTCRMPNDSLLDRTYKGHVLVAEDVRTNQRLIQVILERLGLNVTIAEDGDQAVAKGAGGTFDLILMDVRMPGLNGLEATRALRRREISTPIVALTAHTMSEDRRECIEAGCNAYLSKPVDRAELIHVMDRYLPRQRRESARPFDVSGTKVVTVERRDPVAVSADITGPAGELDIIDWAQLISRIVDEELAEDIMPIAVQDNRDRLDKLTKAVEDENIADVRLYAHAMKGSMMNVGANRVLRVARSLEHMAGKGDLSKAQEYLVRIREEFERFETLVSKPDWLDIVKRGQDHGQNTDRQLQSYESVR